jgi:predicted  nucleic acid-binding Zn-ribbon protein
MKPEDQLNMIMEHFASLQDDIKNLETKTIDLNDAHNQLKHSNPDSEQSHPELKGHVEQLRSTIDQRMENTQKMIESALHPDRMVHIQNFMDVMQQTLDSMEK